MVRVYRLIGIIFFSAMLLISYFLDISNEESKPEQYRVWNEESILEESDFLRRPPFYEGEAAAMIYYNFRQYKSPEVKVAVIQDRFNSFIHKHRVGNDLIRHEEYHLRLAHFFAKEINQLIEEKKLTFQESHQFLLDQIQTNKQYQKLYDRETNHSRDRVKQNYWEYKIDSMLNKSIDFPIFQETEDVAVYFPEKPNGFVLVLPDANFNGYKLEKYDVKFWIADLNMFTTDTSAIEDFWIYTIASEGHSNIIINRDYPYERLIFDSYSKDTVENEVVLDKLLLGKKSTYWLRTRYPIVEENEEVYKKMADQFFNSFKVIDE